MDIIHTLREKMLTMRTEQILKDHPNYNFSEDQQIPINPNLLKEYKAPYDINVFSGRIKRNIRVKALKKGKELKALDGEQGINLQKAGNEYLELDDLWGKLKEHDADDKVKILIVSHKVNAKVSGQLHNEMFFSDTGRDRVKSGTTYGLYTRRVDLKGLSKSKLQNLLKDKEEIVWDNGERNKRVVLAHLEKHKDFKEYPTFTMPDGTKRKIKHIKILQPKQRSIVAALGPGSGAHVDKDENHHMVIYETPEENIAFKVVSRFDAAMRLSKHQPVIQRDANTGRFLLSICIGDTLFLPADPGKGTSDRYVTITSLWGDGRII